MKKLRPRFTVRRMMIMVAVVAILLYAYRVMPSLRDIFDDPFGAINTSKKSWDVGPSPSVTVDLFEGTVQVFPSVDNKVRAEIATVAVSEFSRSDADRALRTIDLSFDQRGDSLRITARGASEAGIGKETHVDLHVPRGVKLDLRTGRGEIRVGRDYAGNTPVHRPIAASSIRARNDSKYRLGYAEGNIIIETVAPSDAAGGPPIPTRLQLDAPGHIEILAESAVIEARAWHGVPPKGWTPADYESEDEGTITFEGSFAEGTHSLRAAHRIKMRLSDATALRVTAEAAGGGITGDLLPQPVEQRNGRARWNGSIGSDPRGVLRLQADDGPIIMDKNQ